MTDMRLDFLWFAVFALLQAAAATVAAQDAPIRITDDRGSTLTLAQPPRRIVSILPSLTESVCVLGACTRLVGVDRYSGHPEAVTRLPVVGGGIDPNIEAIVALRPDVVLAATSSRAALRLEALGIPVVALEPQSHADVLRVLALLQDLLQTSGAEDARQIWARIDAAVAEAARQVPESMRQARVYFEVSRGPYAAGPSSFIGETLQRLGLRNVIPAELGPFPKLNPEYVLRADPDIVMVSNRSMQVQDLYPGWQNMRAIRSGSVCHFSNEESNILVRPGPRMDEAAQLMLRCLRAKAAPPAAVGAR